MSEAVERIRVPDLKEKKRRGEKIVMLTAYDATMARLFDSAGVDILLVGDSLGMVVMGSETTLPVTLDAMIHHTRAVSRGARRALVVADMPFLTYQVSVSDAIRNAGRLMQEAEASAVKLEGAGAVLEVTMRLVDAGIPVMGHLGLLPQSVHQLGGFRRQAKVELEAQRLVEEALELENAGAFAIVLEAIPYEVARRATEQVSIPTIGIGAGPHCDGQVLVSYDMLGISTAPVPSFVKKYAELGQEMVSAVEAYAADVRAGKFPPAQRTAPGPDRDGG